jgi:hypothetical protein
LQDIEELERFAGELRLAEVIQRDADLFMVVKEEDFLKSPVKVKADSSAYDTSFNRNFCQS